MFGFDEVAGFTHHVETLLDKVRAGQTAISAALVNGILAAKDQITLLLKGEGGGAKSEASLKIIGQLEALSGGQAQPGAPAAGAAGEAGPPPAEAAVYRIQFRPEPGILARGIDPASLLADLRKLGECQIAAKTEDLAPLEDYSPDACRFAWEITLKTCEGVNGIKDVFIFVEDDSQIRIELLGAAQAGRARSRTRSCGPGACPGSRCGGAATSGAGQSPGGSQSQRR